MRLVCAVLFAVAVTAQADLISEYSPDHPGVEPTFQYLELSGTPGAAFSLVLVNIDGDAGSPGGLVKDIGTLTGTYDSSGIALISGLLDYENPSHTLVLCTSIDASVSVGDDLDATNDGTIDDLSLFSGVMDAICTLDLASDLAYADDFSGVNMAFVDFGATSEPTLIFRESSTGALYQTDGVTLFDATATSIPTSSPPWSASPLGPTSGAVNPSLVAVPEPASMGLVGVVGLVAAARRRRAAH